MKSPPYPRPRFFLVPVLFGAAISAVFFALASNYSAWARWSDWLPMGHWPVFGDLTVTLQHLGEAAAGVDPLADPHSHFAYTRVVLELHRLGLQHIGAEWLGLLQNVAFVITFILVLQPRSALQMAAGTLTLASPTVLFAFERANMDLMLFMLCALAAVVWARADRLAPLLAVAAVSIAALFKLYPVFALLGGVLVERGTRRLVWLLGLCGLVGYLAANHTDLVLIAEKVPITTWASWGAVLFFTRVQEHVARHYPALVDWPDTVWQLAGVATYVVAAVLAVLVGRRVAPRFARVEWPARAFACFWIGAAICCGSFAGSNLSYRWVFLLLTFPLLATALHAQDRAVVLWARVLSVAVGACLVTPVANLDKYWFLLTQFAHWSCILLLLVGCAALLSAAPWVRSVRPVERASDDEDRALANVVAR